VRTLSSLLLSTALLLVGHGMQLTLLPLRGAGLGHTDQQIAIGGSAYFSGFIIGCLLVPKLIARVGHIRSFAVLASAMTSSVLVIGLTDAWWLWALLRCAVGFFICGLYSVIESWLNDQASAENRGKVLSVYTFLVLVSMALGQQLINAAPLDSATPFMLLAAVLALSTIPVSMTRKLAPAPIESTRSRIRLLFRRSPVAAAGALLSGAITGSFWSLGAVFAQRSLDSTAAATLFVSAAILGGAALQYPFGWLSDRLGRPAIMLLLVVLGTGASAGLALLAGGPWIMPAAFAFGACSMPLYAMALATAADNSLRHEFVEIGTSVLLLNAIGAVFAPLMIGQLMVRLGQAWLFWSCCGLSGMGALFFLTQLRRKAPVEDTVPFSAAASDMTPTRFGLDPRSPLEASGDLAPAPEALSLDDADSAS
jgi:MFS family permease